MCGHDTPGDTPPTGLQILPLLTSSRAALKLSQVDERQGRVLAEFLEPINQALDRLFIFCEYLAGGPDNGDL